MKRKIIYTQDGSTTLEIEAWGEHYHSMRGAIGEAYHVFIHQGLELFARKEIFLLEIGLGTGLNAFITFLEHERLQQTIHYEGVEAYPLTAEGVARLPHEVHPQSFGLPPDVQLHSAVDREDDLTGIDGSSDIDCHVAGGHLAHRSPPRGFLVTQVREAVRASRNGRRHMRESRRRWGG